MTKKRWLWIVGWVLTLVLVGGACLWAGTVVTRTPPTASTLPNSSMLTEVVNDSVGRTLTYNVTVTQKRTPIASNLLTGVVTAVNTADSYKPGDTVYSVDSIPVRVVSGTTPFYRDLSRDVVGQDVRQLNQALVDLGYLGSAGDRFTAATETAVKKWQKALGMDTSGVVARGELIAVPSLPQALFIDAKTLSLGAVLAGGEAAISAAGGEPEFSLDLSEDQAKQIPSDATVSITYQGHTWQAVITGSGPKQDASGTSVYSLTLGGADGGSVCGTECSALPAQETLYIPASIEIIPAVSGPAVPVTALSTQPDGQVTVDVVSGDKTTHTPVTVKSSVDGVAIVEGLKVGQKVRVYGSATATQGGSQPTPATSTGEATDQASSGVGNPASTDAP